MDRIEKLLNETLCYMSANPLSGTQLHFVKCGIKEILNDFLEWMDKECELELINDLSNDQLIDLYTTNFRQQISKNANNLKV